ncbi:porin [Herminiimonas arsenitoxidans]|uniref:porin n=1 Tax=Herminiimonas arsenitoxidans TaxID=1809410 RepID=UPI0009703CAC|nr:porin [Herminiimonas arsenitoxidans]
MKLIKHAAIGSVLGLVASAFSMSAFAQSNVQVGGMVDVYAGSIKRSGDAASTSVVNSSGMQTSWWGFKGTEELGGGLQAQFALTGFFRPDVGGMGRNNTDTMFARDANVGLSGSFGRVSLGRDLAPNFVPTLTFNPFGSSFAFSPLGLHTQTSSSRYRGQAWSATVSGDTAWSNEIMYVTPQLGGFTTSLFLQLGEQAGKSGKNNYGVNTMYAKGPLSFGGYFQSVKVSNPVDSVTTGDSRVFTFTPYNQVTGATYTLAASKNDTWFVGGAYDLQFMKLFGTLNYSTTKLIGAVDDSKYDLKSNTVQLGVSVPVGKGSVLASWARTNVKAEGDFTAVLGSSDVRSSIVRNTASLGYDYFLSKRTDVYTVASYDKLTDQASGISFGVGIRQRF